VPKILATTVESFRESGGSNDQAKQDAGKHGEERWRQGYRVREVLLEIFWLRTVLFQEATVFAAGQPDALMVSSAICEQVDRVCSAISSTGNAAH
jgi:hypothetical protein